MKNLKTVFLAMVFAVWPGWLPAQTTTSPLKGLSAPASSEQPWLPPDLRSYSQVLRQVAPLPIEPGKEYELLDLIDLAERINPKTRIAWEQARAAAAAVGIAQSEYYPTLALKAGGNWIDLPVAVQAGVLTSTAHFDFQSLSAGGSLEYVLLDFGRRKAEVTGAQENLMAANLGFNAEHQQVVFNVQKAFYALSAAQGQIAVAKSALAAAAKVREATEARVEQGLATTPDLALAQQQEVKAEFDLAEATARENDDYVTLAESVGIPPTAPIRVAGFSHLAMPAILTESVEAFIDRALEHRPDLLARVADLREKEAKVKRARAEYHPTLSLSASAAEMSFRQRLTIEGSAAPTWEGGTEPTWILGFSFKFPLFDGGRLRNELEKAKAAHAVAEEELKESRDTTISQVWRSYTNAKLAFQRLEVARALVTASDKAYQGTFEAYQHGLGSLVDLLAARREADRALQVELETRTAVLESSAALAFSSGAMRNESTKRVSTH